MNRRVLIEPEAELDLHEAYGWYERQRVGLGHDFLLCYEAVENIIAERPGSFPILSRRTRRALLRRFPYSVLFTEIGNDIVVVGIFHTSRDPKRWQPRIH